MPVLRFDFREICAQNSTARTRLQLFPAAMVLPELKVPEALALALRFAESCDDAIMRGAAHLSEVPPAPLRPTVVRAKPEGPKCSDKAFKCKAHRGEHWSMLLLRSELEECSQSFDTAAAPEPANELDALCGARCCRGSCAEPSCQVHPQARGPV